MCTVCRPLPGLPWQRRGCGGGSHTSEVTKCACCSPRHPPRTLTLAPGPWPPPGMFHDPVGKHVSQHVRPSARPAPAPPAPAPRPRAPTPPPPAATLAIGVLPWGSQRLSDFSRLSPFAPHTPWSPHGLGPPAAPTDPAAQDTGGARAGELGEAANVRNQGPGRRGGGSWCDQRGPLPSVSWGALGEVRGRSETAVPGRGHRD